MTTPAETDDFDLVSQDPAAWYPLPQAILDDPQLSRDEKQRLLDEWAQDLGDRSTAADEGMVPDVPGLIDGDVKLHDRVKAAQAALAGLPERDDAPTFVERLWRRIVGSDQPANGAKLTE